MDSKRRFEIEIKPQPDGELAGIAVRVEGEALTRLLRPGDSKASDYLLAPPGLLARWLADNWWRLRWESIPPREMSAGWRMAHDLGSVGGGYAWPHAIIWGQDTRIGISAQPDPVGVVGPVRFLAEFVRSVAASDFETEVDRFLDEVCAGKAAGEGLRQTVTAFREERGDPETAAWRRLEARLGFDPDGAPGELMNQMGDFIQRFGEADVEEAASAAPGLNAANVLRQEIESAQGAHAWSCAFSSAARALGQAKMADCGVPWQRGESAAANVRTALGLAGPLSDSVFSGLLNVTPDAFQASPPQGLPYGIRLRTQAGDRVFARSKWRVGRRFEFARALGDFIAAGPGDAPSCSLGPIAASTTARQKFQRAFAQHLLCPFDELKAYLATDHPDDEDVEAAAAHFDVSRRLVQTTLVNHGVISHQEFDQLVEAV